MKSTYPGVVLHYSKTVLPFLRVSVAHALFTAAQQLSAMGYTIHLYDCYRSLHTQQQKFIQRVQEMQKIHPEVSGESLLQLANTYTAGIPILAAHTSGAAVDVGLVDQHGQDVDMGTAYGDATKQSMTTCLTISKKAQQYRKILCDVMQQVGLINYPFEWWHFSMGDVGAAYVAHQAYAHYGPVEYGNNTSVFVTNERVRTWFSFQLEETLL
jgi:D-alanyl-D-alanine dipeptidase